MSSFVHRRAPRAGGDWIVSKDFDWKPMGSSGSVEISLPKTVPIQQRAGDFLKNERAG